MQHPRFAMLAADIGDCAGRRPTSRFAARDVQAEFRVLADRLRAYFVKTDGQPRGDTFAGTGFTAGHCASDAGVEASSNRRRGNRSRRSPKALRAFRRDLNVVLSRGVWRVFAVAL